MFISSRLPVRLLLAGVLALSLTAVAAAEDRGATPVEPPPPAELSALGLDDQVGEAVSADLVRDGTPFFRGFWADAFVPGFKSTSEISSMVSRAVTGRYNAIIAEVLAYHDTAGGGHGAYWNSSIVPKATDITGGIDPLAQLVSQAHASGLEVHAWIVPFRACLTWPPSGNTRLSPHPEYLMVPQGDMGTIARVDTWYYLDPGSPGVQEYLLSIVRELATNYQIDGINWDYIRYTQTDAGYPTDPNYAESSLARFRRLYGYAGTPGPTDPNWSDFRRMTINEIIRRARAEIPSITSNPRQPLRHTADLICYGYAPSSFPSSDAYNLFQNWKYWQEQGWLDAGVPMNYKREWQTDQAAMYRSWVDAAINWRYSRHMYCGQGNYLNPKADSVTQLLYCISAGADGTCNYSYYDTADENKNGTPEHDWTWYTYVASNVFTSPAPPPTMPWRDPNQATEGTVWGRATDPATGTPIEFATVTAGGQPSVLTDGNGYYTVTLVPANPGGSSCTIMATKSGCSAVSIPNVMVYPGDVTRQDVHMCNSAPAPGDMNLDGDLDLSDFNAFTFYMRGPDVTYGGGSPALRGDADGDHDLDMMDAAWFQQWFTGPL